MTHFLTVDLLHADQTVVLTLSSKSANGQITCSTATVDQLEKDLLAHLNADAASRVTDTTCEFSPTGNNTCSTASIVFNIKLSCAGKRANGNLIDNVKEQQVAITKIMERKTSEQFTFGAVSIIVRLFRESERRKAPLPTCSSECTKVEQGIVTLCNCSCKLSNCTCKVIYHCVVSFYHSMLRLNKAIHTEHLIY